MGVMTNGFYVSSSESFSLDLLFLFSSLGFSLTYSYGTLSFAAKLLTNFLIGLNNKSPSKI